MLLAPKRVMLSLGVALINVVSKKLSSTPSNAYVKFPLVIMSSLNIGLAVCRIF